MSSFDAEIQKYKEILETLPSNTFGRVQPLHKLSIALWNRYRQQDSIEDLEAAIFCSEAIEGIGDSLHHPILTWASHAISRSTDSPEQFFDFITGEKFDPYARRLASFVNTSADERYHLAVELAGAAHSTTPHFAVRAYRTALSIRERCLIIHFDTQLQYQFITSTTYQSIIRDAAACAIECGQVAAAVEILEQGRGQIWSVLRDTSFPLSDLPGLDDNLNDKFRQCLVRLLLLPPESEPIYAMAEQWNSTLHEIRKLDGFSDLLRTRPYHSIRAAAAEGPVIIINTSSFRCDALVVWRDDELPSLVPLEPSLHVTIPRLSAIMSQIKGHIRGSRPWLGHRRTPEQALSSVLSELWKHVAEPIVKYLLEKAHPKHSRVWWCPTGPLASLPLHAAGDYSNHTECLPDIFVSSYAPTLSSLIRARASMADLADVVRGNSLLAIAQSNALPHVKAELHVLKQLFREDVYILDSEDAKPDPKLLHDHAWLHFACHGFLNIAQPLESYFELFGGNLKLVDIINDTRLSQRGEIAFLATCHSAASETEGVSDEGISLAGAMLGIGFRSVVGTLWAMSDQDGPTLTETFYRHLLGDGAQKVDVERSAFGLHLATDVMRRAGIPVERWCTFIHVGV